MKNITKFLLGISVFLFNFSSSQTIMKSLSEAKNIEQNKNEFIGLPFNHLLSRIEVPIISVLPAPNKDVNEVNRIYLRFITNNEFKRTNINNLKDRPTQLVIVFNQNWELAGDQCMSSNPRCTEWTETDRQNLGNLVVYDIYVLGKN